MRAFLCLVLLLGLSSIRGGETVAGFNFERHKKEGPSPDFKQGFKQGVRYGTLAFLQDPKEDSIPKIEDKAMQLYWLYVIDEGRTLIDSLETNAPPTNRPAKKP